MPTQRHEQLTDDQIKGLMERSPVFKEPWHIYLPEDSGLSRDTDIEQLREVPSFQVFLAVALYMEHGQERRLDSLAEVAEAMCREEEDLVRRDAPTPMLLDSEEAMEHLTVDEFLTGLEWGALLLAADREIPEELIPEELARRKAEMRTPELFGLGVRSELPPMVALSREISRAMDPEWGKVTSPVFGTAWYQYHDEFLVTSLGNDHGVRVFSAGADAVAAKDQTERTTHLEVMRKVVEEEADAARKAGEEPVNLRSQRAVFLLHQNGHLTNEEATALSLASR